MAQSERPMHTNCTGNVLIIDDEPNALRVLSAVLAGDGHRTLECSSVDAAISAIREKSVDAVITDMKMPDRDGMEFFSYASEHHPDIPVIFLTAYGTIDAAVTAMQHGAFYYFIKPPDYPKLKGILTRAIEQRRLKKEIESLRLRLQEDEYHRRLIGQTPQMRKIHDTIVSVRGSMSSVLIQGETGTGKELIARALHSGDGRAARPFVAVNCSALPRELIEAELFGYEKGAFTGAYARRAGKFEEADGGIMFLDEIGEMELSLQAKLLRTLQEREVERLGSNRKIKVDFRLVSSTNRDLRKAVADGVFREDLLYRINVIEIRVPPLRERRDDIPLLAAAFLDEFCTRERKTFIMTPEVIGILQCYPWPGNVRQLRNVIERLVVLSPGGEISPQELPEEFMLQKRQKALQRSARTLKDIEMQAVRDALRACNGNKSRACKILGISRKAFYNRLRELVPEKQGFPAGAAPLCPGAGSGPSISPDDAPESCDDRRTAPGAVTGQSQ